MSATTTTTTTPPPPSAAPAAPAPAATVANPWLKGPPPEIQAQRNVVQQQQQSGSRIPAQQPQQQQQPNSTPLPPPPPPVQVFRPAVKIARAHHHLPLEEAQIHAYQLGIAQQMAIIAAQSGMDLPNYQMQLAMSYGYDPRLLNMTPEPGTRLEGTEPPLGLTLVRDDQAYTHVELLSRYPHLASINLTAVDLEPRKAAFFLVTCHERQVHESIKYGYWTIPSEGAAALNRVFGELHGMGPVYFLMASTDTVAFSGVCQMLGPASPVQAPEKAAPTEGSEDVASAPSQQRFPVRWIFCKNIPFSHMQHVALRPANKEAEEQRRQHGGLQPMKIGDGTRALGIYARYNAAASVLMDFKHYDEAEAKGAIAESGEAAIRAAQKYQQKMMYQQPHGHSHNYRQGFHRSYNQNQQPPLQQQQLNPQMFPTPAQAQSKTTAEPSAPGSVSTDSAQPAPVQQREGQSRHHNQGFRGGHRGSGGQHHGGPSRRIVTADEESVNLQTKYVFEPVVKEKQKERRRRNRLVQENADAEYADEAVYYEGQQLEQTEQGQEEAADEDEVVEE